ncbi:unnamed protein product [Rotaria socialis]|uniref:Uncharacterized protein n=1 Tax=Rotaria socialis TaxID=392032 RepID=A0A821F323_9BILA|nr:unnamed protein product [Rotaria socialis]
MRKIYLIIYELTCSDSLQNHPNATDTIRVLIAQNNMLLDNNIALHQQVESDHQLQETLSNLSQSNSTLTAELHKVKKEVFI